MFREDWHLEDRANPLVRQYQNTLDSVLREHPHLSRCVTHCVHCDIRFLTHPRNAGRNNLRCPFGCRQHHRRQASIRRSIAYYRTDQGKRQKEAQNIKRKKKAARRQQHEPCPQQNQPDSTESSQPSPSCGPSPSCRQEHTPQGASDELPADMQLVLDGIVLTPQIITASGALSYLTMVIGLIEGRSISRSDLVAHLLQLLRQHSMAYRSRRDYVLGFLQQHPP